MPSKQLVRASAVAFLVALLGCGDDSESVTFGGMSDRDPSSGATSDEFEAPDTLILVTCSTDPADATVTLTLSAVSASDGEPRGERQVTVSGVRQNLLRMGACPGRDSSRRQRFNEDFTQVALQVHGPNGAGTRAVAAAVPSGEILGPTVGEDSFTAAPDESWPMFDLQTGDLWYIDENSGRLLSRPADAAATETVDHGETSYLHVAAVVDGSPWVAADPDVAVNPSATYAAASSVAPGMDLWAAGTDWSDDTVPISSLGGVEVPYDCAAELWIDDHSVLCHRSSYDGFDQEDLFYRVRLSQGYDSVADVQELVPATDRENETPVLSPDGDAFAFVSTQGRQRAIYVQDLSTPGAEPTKIVEITGEQTLMEWQ